MNSGDVEHDTVKLTILKNPYVNPKIVSSILRITIVQELPKNKKFDLEISNSPIYEI